jgi:hypothetical protein
LRASNENAIRSYLSQTNPRIISEFDAADAWDTIPATNLPYLSLAKIYRIVESERNRFA